MFENFKHQTIVLFATISVALGLTTGVFLDTGPHVTNKIASVAVIMLAIAFIAEMGMPTQVKKKRDKAGLGVLTGESRFQDVVENAPDSILMLDNKGYLTFMNKTAEAMFGYRRKELLGKHFAEANIFSQGSLKAAFMQFTNLMSGNASPPYSARFVRRGGTEFGAEVNHRPIIIEGIVTGVELIIRQYKDKERKTPEGKT